MSVKKRQLVTICPARSSQSPAHRNARTTCTATQMHCKRVAVASLSFHLRTSRSPEARRESAEAGHVPVTRTHDCCAVARTGRASATVYALAMGQWPWVGFAVFIAFCGSGCVTMSRTHIILPVCTSAAAALCDPPQTLKFLRGFGRSRPRRRGHSARACAAPVAEDAAAMQH